MFGQGSVSYGAPIVKKMSCTDAEDFARKMEEGGAFSCLITDLTETRCLVVCRVEVE